MAFAGCFDRTGEIMEACMIDFERNWIEAMGWIAKRHLSRVAEETEAGHVGHGMNWLCGLGLFFNFLEAGSSGGVESAHGPDSGSERFGGCAIFFQGSRYDAGSQWLGKEKYVSRLGSYVAPNSLRMD